jgi:hypothetical protein
MEFLSDQLLMARTIADPSAATSMPNTPCRDGLACFQTTLEQLHRQQRRTNQGRVYRISKRNQWANLLHVDLTLIVIHSDH